MKTLILPVFGIILLHGIACAQDDIPLLRPEERKAVDEQTEQFNDSLVPILKEAAKSTVRVWDGKRRLAYGTVIDDGHKVLTKWSEVARATGEIRVEAAGGEVLPAKVAGVYEKEDLAVLETTGTALTPVKWSDDAPVLGGFLAAPQPDGRPAAFGVTSVLERNLRDTDRAFLGVISDLNFKGPGVLIREIAPESGAATAGLRPGDIILKVGERPISGVMELKNSLVGLEPGSTTKLHVSRNGKQKDFNVLLGNRPKLQDYPGDRLRQMERMGGPISQVRNSFPNAIQSDMRPKPNQVGGPVVNLKGNIVGITIARADRTRSFIIPSSALKELLKQTPQDPSLALAGPSDQEAAMPVREMPPTQRLRPGAEARMRRHLAEMQRLMEFMRDEMNELEPSR